MRTRSLAASAIAFATLGVLLTANAMANEGDAVWRTFKGKILVSDKPFETNQPTEPKMIAALRKQSKTQIAGGGNWTLNLMVFLKEPAGAETINIVYYDVSAKPREQVNFSEVQVQSDQRSIKVDGVSISKELGFVKGHKYDVLATRLINGKEVVYARANIVLK